jgi:hypothetical protein
MAEFYAVLDHSKLAQDKLHKPVILEQCEKSITWSVAYVLLIGLLKGTGLGLR